VGSAVPVGSAAPAGSGSATALPPPPPAVPSGSVPSVPPPPPPAPPGQAPGAAPQPGAPPPPAYGQGRAPAYGYGQRGYYGQPPYPPPRYAPVEPPPPAKPKGVHLHDGFYFRADLGFGYLHESATFKTAGISADQTQSGGAGSMLLLFGGTPIDGFAIGGGMFFASAGSPKAGGNTSGPRGSLDSEGLLGLTGFGDYYFDPKGGFHLMGLVGFGGLSWSDANGNQAPGDQQPSGVVLGGGVGYDFWVGSQWSLGVLARVLYAPMSTSYTPNGATDAVHYSSRVVLPVLAFTVLDH